jgi:NAD(P)-dependent dehydrogenase (short-subunit alcohol dehydrogenase family)
MKITGQTALITGGCGGIGLASAQHFLAQGKRVILLDREIEKGRRVLNDHKNAKFVQVDLADRDALAGVLNALAAEELSPDVLVNNAGISPKLDASGNRLKTWTINLDQWDDVLATNLTPYFQCIRHCLPAMMERKSGRIINIGSYAARTGGYQATMHYQVSKSAIFGLTRAVAREAAPYGITVNTVNPGRIVTPMTADVSPEVNAAFIQSVPLGRLGVPEDIAKAIVFLASDYADYITGAAIEVNGGVFMSP